MDKEISERRQKMKTSTIKILCVCVVLALLIGAGCTERNEESIYHNQELVNVAHEYYELDMETEKTEGDATRLFLPELRYKIPELFAGYTIYSHLIKYSERRKGEKYLLVIGLEEVNEFSIFYDILKPLTGAIQFSGVSSGFEHMEEYARENSEELLEFAEKCFRESLACYKKRKGQEEDFRQESRKLGDKLYQVEYVLTYECWESIKKSTRGKIKEINYYFRIPSDSFGHIGCRINASVYKSVVTFDIRQIELGKSPLKQEFFDVNRYGRHFGFINNEVGLEAFGVLVDALDLIEAAVAEDHEILRKAIWEKSVK